MPLVGVVCCQIEVSAKSRSLARRSPTECGVSECDREALIMRRPWPTGGCCAIKNNRIFIPYRAVNTLPLSYENLSVNSVWRNNLALLWDPYGPRKYILLEKCRVFAVLNLVIYIAAIRL
jgi:hypothetical protein